MNVWHHTTVLAVRRDGAVALGSDGQVTLGNTVMKHSAAKVRRLGSGNIVAGFAGSVADALALFTRFEAKLEAYGHNLERAAVELAREWRTDRALRHLEAMLITADVSTTLLVSGTGEVLSPDDDVVAVGSGGSYALAAARALLAHTGLSAREVVEEALKIAGSIDIYTNQHITIEELTS
jgi:ATP-dependent HslUV protease subunit HslV